MDLSIIVPLYNEEESIDALYAGGHRRGGGARPQSEITYELLLVDDGSSDGTPEKLRELCARDPRVRAAPMRPAGDWAFCSLMAFWMSLGVMPNDASLSGRARSRME